MTKSGIAYVVISQTIIKIAQQDPYLCSPQQTDKDDHGKTILLLRRLHNGHNKQHNKHGNTTQQDPKRPAEQPLRTPVSPNRRIHLLHIRLDVVALPPYLATRGIASKQCMADTDIRRLRFPLDSNHLSPNRVPLPDDVFAQV